MTAMLVVESSVDLFGTMTEERMHRRAHPLHGYGATSNYTSHQVSLSADRVASDLDKLQLRDVVSIEDAVRRETAEDSKNERVLASRTGSVTKNATGTPLVIESPDRHGSRLSLPSLDCAT